MSHSAVQIAEAVVQISGALLTLVVTPAVLVYGGRPERIAVLASLAAYLLTPVAQAWAGSWSYWPLAVLLVDASLCGLLIVLLIRYDREWLSAAVGVEAFTALTNLSTVLDRSLTVRGYVVHSWAYYFIFLAVLAFSLVEVRWRRARGLEA